MLSTDGSSSPVTQARWRRASYRLSELCVTRLKVRWRRLLTKTLSFPLFWMSPLTSPFHCHPVVRGFVWFFFATVTHPPRGSLPSCLLYQRDPHLKKPTVPPLCWTLACSHTNRPWPTCSFSSRLPSYHQVGLGVPSFDRWLFRDPCMHLAARCVSDMTRLLLYVSAYTGGIWISLLLALETCTYSSNLTPEQVLTSLVLSRCLDYGCRFNALIRLIKYTLN